MRSLKYLLTATLAVICSFQADAQSMIKDSILPAFVFGVGYSYEFPFADMAKLYGSNSAVGAFLGYKTKKNWIITGEGTAIIGENVKESNPFLGAASPDGILIGQDGTLENWTLHERGFMLKVVLGKVIHFRKPNVNSGLFIQVGGGMIQHKIRIEIDPAAIQVIGPYNDGYDHLANGGMLSQFVGYLYMGQKHRINCYGGLEVSEGFVKGRRIWNYALDQPDDYRQFDLLVGVKIGWIIPKFFVQTEKYYTY